MQAMSVILFTIVPPTFLWSGTPLSENDAIFDDSKPNRRQNDLGVTSDLSDLADRIESDHKSVVERLDNQASIVEIYNFLMCADCLARLLTVFVRAVSRHK